MVAAPDIPDFHRAYDYLRHYGERRPESEAAISAGARLTYRELKRRVDQCARALIAAGISPGDRVAYLSPPHHEYLVILLATLAVGGIAVGVNPRYRRREIAHVLNDAAPSILFSRARIGSRSYAADLSAACAPATRLVTMGEGESPAGGEPLAEFMLRGGSITFEELKARTDSTEGESPCLIIYTSGTTGAPKGVLLKQNAALRHGKIFLRRFQLKTLRAVNYYPTNHVAGVVANTLQTLVGGGAQVCMERFDAGEVLSIIESERITIWGGIPTMLQMCASHENFETADLSSVRVLLWSGGELSPELARKLSRRVPRLATLFAMTETTGGVTAIESDSFADALCHSVGRPLPDVEIRIAGEEGEAVSHGETGELLVRGAFLMIGYWNNPEATAAAIDAQGWLRTGDLAQVDHDGCIRLVGRRIEMFKSGGYNVYPKEVEAVLESHAGVAGAVVVATKDELYGEVGAAFVQAGSVENPVSEESLLEYCRQNLANYKVPKRIYVWLELPMLANGKFDRKRLVEQAAMARGPLRGSR